MEVKSEPRYFAMFRQKYVVYVWYIGNGQIVVLGNKVRNYKKEYNTQRLPTHFCQKASFCRYFERSICPLPFSLLFFPLHPLPPPFFLALFFLLHPSPLCITYQEKPKFYIWSLTRLYVQNYFVQIISTVSFRQ